MLRSVVVALLCGLLCSLASAASQPRERQSFNRDWRYSFSASDAGADAAQPAFDDSAWARVGLPHSFSTPYFLAPDFPAGIGWYRKALDLRAVPASRRWALEFEGAFQVATVYVNGREMGQHRGGYTGFRVDLTPALHAGRNLIAVKVDNRWDPTLAPRAGEHVFSGGLYRDVWLLATDSVHVPWTGVGVTTPGLPEGQPRVQVQTEVRNTEARALDVSAEAEVLTDAGRPVARLAATQARIEPGQTLTLAQQSAVLRGIQLWSPETPALYRVRTTLKVGGRVRDVVETSFGFRWVQWTADKGFFLNGLHRYFRGANAHQDQAGWGDAVTNAAIDRDVQQMKAAGFDFLRGSHYPKDPQFADSTDRRGMLFLSESPFWGTAPFAHAWGASAYPTDARHVEAFEASVKQQLTEMIRSHRNHPSIVAWSLCNEVFFTAAETLPAVRRLLKELVLLSHQLDPTRLASVSGAQRGELDHLGDIAGYNGDGAVLFQNPGVPSFVAEYGSTIADRPGPFDPGWGDIEKTPGARAGEPASWRPAWRAGEAIWAGFDHGSIAGRFGWMGIVDYSRLPKRAWHWYRQHYLGIAPPAWPEAGVAAGLRLSASAPAIRRTDGTDDVQLVITVVDAQGRALSNSPPVKLVIESGPGELPTGREIAFTPDGDIPIRDGQAAIALRSWQAGLTRLRASSPGLKDGVLAVPTLKGPAFVAGKTPLAAPRPYVAYRRPAAVGKAVQAFGHQTPIRASSSQAGHGPSQANDGAPDTYWSPATGDAAPWIEIDTERIVTPQRLLLSFVPGRACALEVLNISPTNAPERLAQWAPSHPSAAPDSLTLPLADQAVRVLRLALLASPGAPACAVAELSLEGHLRD